MKVRVPQSKNHKHIGKKISSDHRNKPLEDVQHQSQIALIQCYEYKETPLNRRGPSKLRVKHS